MSPTPASAAHVTSFEPQHDLFLSFTHEDTEKARSLNEAMAAHGLRVYWADRKLKPGQDYPDQLAQALVASQHFAILCSRAALASPWVRREYTIFHERCHVRDVDNRRMYVVLLDCSAEDLPPLLGTLQRPASSEALVAELLRCTLLRLQTNIQVLEDSRRQELDALRLQLRQEQEKLAEARRYYYGHNRFWGLLAECHDVHIFTCGRNVPHADTGVRGFGGRTNIDLWDYRAVLALTHFFASNYPTTRVTIVDPMSKLHGEDLSHAPRLADRIAHIREMLANKDCIIVGSPDVNDFAEIVLAKIHGIDPYTDVRSKKTGFVIIKERKHASSTFYWQSGGNEREGIARILRAGDYRYFQNAVATEDGRVGRMYGILVVARNRGACQAL